MPKRISQSDGGYKRLGAGLSLRERQELKQFGDRFSLVHDSERPSAWRVVFVFRVDAHGLANRRMQVADGDCPVAHRAAIGGAGTDHLAAFYPAAGHERAEDARIMVASLPAPILTSSSMTVCTVAIVLKVSPSGNCSK